MSLAIHVQQRYLAKTWAEIVSRVARGPIVQEYAMLKSVKDKSDMEMLLLSKTFIPAGNTLTWGHSTKPHSSNLRPNCSILHEPSVDKIVEYWKNDTGVGTCVLKAGTNPVKLMQAYQDAWNKHDPLHRPKRGNMFVYPIDGPHILDFIATKSTQKNAEELNAFNISVGVHNALHDFPRNVLSKIAQAAWTTGDPGVVFLDRVNQNVPLIHKTNVIRTLVPCGEQGMYDGETCTLGSINLASEALAATKRGDVIDMVKLTDAIRLAVRFLDGAVTAINPQDRYRRIGLGVMGWADLLDTNGIDYSSKRALSLARHLSCFIGARARLESCRLAKETSVFPAWADEHFYANSSTICIDSAALPEHEQEIRTYRYKMRNVSVTCLPPTGGITLLTDNYGFSIEPYFNWARMIDTEAHLDMANAWQTGVCNAVSKTINMPHGCTPLDIEFAIQYARMWTKLKAVSVYRDKSRNSQPIRL
jgi:ribonucleoside-diphosphate reductase alpha chain